MTLSRPFRIGLVLLFLFLAATGIYLYRNLDAILQRQVQQALQSFGVEEYQLQKPRLGTGTFTASALSLLGHYEDHDYDISLKGIEVRYDWRILLTRQAESISISGLDIRASAGAIASSSGADTEPAIVELSMLMPDAMLAELPTRALEIGELQLEYITPDALPLVGTGHLRYRGSLDASLQVPLADTEVQLTAHAAGTSSPLQLGLTLREGQSAMAEFSAQPEAVAWNDWEWQIRGAWEYAPLLGWFRRLAERTQLPAPPAGLLLAGSGTLIAQVRHPDTLAIDSETMREQIHALRADASLASSIAQLDYPGFIADLAPALDISVSVDDGMLQLGLNLAETGGHLEANLQGSLNLKSGQGEFDLRAHSDNLPALLTTLEPSLRELGADTADVTLDSGRFTLATQLECAGYSPEQCTQTSHVELADVSGLYGEYRFDALLLAAGWTGVDKWQTVQPLSLSLASLDVGFDITDIRARASMPQETPIAAPDLAIEAFSANLFGGKAYLPEPAEWHFGADSNTLTLRAEEWQLSQIVALQQSEDIRAQGILEGELPITLTNERITIEKGYLRALPPGGTIRYAADNASRALGQSSKQLEMALNLLSDFRYEVLSSAVELDESGNLLLGLSLAGNNPDQYEGRQVNFNINLEQNLDPLLQSLRLSGKLTEEIENRLQ